MPELALSVVVPTRGGARRLPTLLDALVAQAIDEPWEVVVVLDGDVDGTRAVVDSYADRLPLRRVDLPGGGGVAAALTAGYSAARGEVVLRCDDDLTPGPGLLAGHLAHHRARPSASPPLGVISMTRDVFADTPYATAYGRPANERLLAEAYARPAGERWRHWAACNSVRRETYEAVGGFDPTLTYREDSELGLRLAKAGVEIVIDPALEIEHRGPASTVRQRVTRAFTSGASTRDFDDRHPDRATPDARRNSVWQWAVLLVARRIGSQERAAALGGLLDVAVGLVPPRTRPKVIALGVEAAGEAGRRRGAADWTREDRRQPTAALNVIYDLSLAQHAREFGEGARPTLLPYGVERLHHHDIALLDAPRLRPTKPIRVLEHRTGIRMQPLRALRWARQADATFAIWEHWAELPALLQRLPGPYRSKPLFTLVCWAAEDLRSGDSRGAARARRVIRGSDLIFHLSRNQREIFLEHGARDDQLVALSFGVPTEFFTGRVEDEREIDFLSVGVDRGRDYDTLCRAVEGTDLKVSLLTQPERARALHLPRNIEPLGVLPPRDYRDLLTRTKVVVVPTHELAYPTGQTVALNAAASGCAVIVTHTPAMAEYFTDKRHALMPPPHDPTALRAAMRQLLDAPELRELIARRGQDHVRQQHRSDAMWDQAASAIHGFMAATSARAKGL